MIWNWRKERKRHEERLQGRKLKGKGENERKEVEKVETISKLEWKSRKQCQRCRTVLQGEEWPYCGDQRRWEAIFFAKTRWL
jgi:hypothetical protein